jgi:hypothetical protein
MVDDDMAWSKHQSRQASVGMGEVEGNRQGYRQHMGMGIAPVGWGGGI